MRKTLDIDDDVLSAAEDLAAARGSTLGKALSDLARGSLHSETAIRNGVPLLPPRAGARPVTPEDVYRPLDVNVDFRARF